MWFNVLPRTVLECFVWQLFRKSFPQENKGTECSISNRLQTEQLEHVGALWPMHQSKGKLSLQVFVPKSQPKGYLSACCLWESVRLQVLILYVHDLIKPIIMSGLKPQSKRILHSVMQYSSSVFIQKVFFIESIYFGHVFVSV